jgi:predicted small metal-binding protein
MINFSLETQELPRFNHSVRAVRRSVMEKLLRCRNFGTDCDFEACGETPEEALTTAVDHARAIHGLKDISDKDRMRARAAVQDAFCVPKGGYNPGGGGFR